jgi:hypothetical protein
VNACHETLHFTSRHLGVDPFLNDLTAVGLPKDAGNVPVLRLQILLNAIAFALDTDDDYVWQIVNGASTLPQTIVLDRNGVVVYNQKGSVTPEILAALYEQASAIK